MTTKKLSEYASLSTAERILVLQDLWDQIADEPTEVPVTADQAAELDRRLARSQDVMSHSSTWPEAKQRIQAKK